MRTFQENILYSKLGDVRIDTVQFARAGFGLSRLGSVRLPAPGLSRGGGALWTLEFVWAGFASCPLRSFRPASRSGPVSVPPVSPYLQ